jgi:hypothetical protein
MTIQTQSGTCRFPAFGSSWESLPRSGVTMVLGLAAKMVATQSAYLVKKKILMRLR